MRLNNREVEYQEEGHIYTVDGEEVISVTELLSWKNPNKFAYVPEELIKTRAEQGSELHNAIECYEEYGLERNDLVEFRNYKFLKERYGFKNVANEKQVLIQYNGLTVCGRLDQLIEMDGKLGIADIKRIKSLNRTDVAYQLNLYRIGYMQCYNEPIEFLKVIQLRDDVRHFITIPINEKATYQLLDKYIKENLK